MEWVDTDAENLTSPQVLCKHASVGVRSAQSFKLFVFGGQVRPMYYSNVIDYYDTGALLLRTPPSDGRLRVEAGALTHSVSCWRAGASVWAR